MNAVTSPIEGVDTLAAWLTAYLAAPETADKAYFTVFDLLRAAGMSSDSQNRSAMARAANGTGLIKARREDGAILRAWHRPGFDMGAATGDITVLCQACHQKGQWRYELSDVTSFPKADADTIRDWITRNTAAMLDQTATCTGCGCTDDRACLGSCWWLAVDREAGMGVCSNCEDHLQAFLDEQHAARLDQQEDQARELLAAYIDNAAEWSLMAYRLETRDIRDRMDDALDHRRRNCRKTLLQLERHISIAECARQLADLRTRCGLRDELPRLVDFDANADRRTHPRGARP